MSSILEFFTILLALNLANHAQATTGQCPENSLLSAMPNFNVTNYLGTWYEIRKKGNAEEVIPKCVSVSAVINSFNKNIIDSVITELVKVNGTWTSVAIPNKANVVENNVGRFIRTFPEAYKSEDGEYLVLDTDYDSFTVVARCVDKDTVTAWIYTRLPKPEASVLKKAFEAASKFGLKSGQFRKIPYTDCSPSDGSQSSSESNEQNSQEKSV